MPCAMRSILCLKPKDDHKMSKLLAISNLEITLQNDSSSRILLRDVHLDLNYEDIVAVVGASGEGKTSLGLAVLRLLPAAMKVCQGSIVFNERDLLALSLADIRRVRGREIGMVFQESLSAFDPVFRIGDQIAEVLQTHLGFSKRRAMTRACELLDLVEISEVQRVAQSYPHELSGGLRQRAMIAQAIAASPKLVIADEPTSNLDVTIQAKILGLFKKLRKEMHLSILLITHDLGLVRFIADRMFVLHDGLIAEEGDPRVILEAPRHDFTKRLLSATKI